MTMNKPRKNYQQALIEEKMSWRKEFFSIIPTIIVCGAGAYGFFEFINFFEGRLVKEMRAMDEFRKQEASGIMAGLRDVQESINALEQTIQTLKSESTEVNEAKINAEVIEPDPELDSVPCCGDPTLLGDNEFAKIIPDDSKFREMFDRLLGKNNMMMQGEQGATIKATIRDLEVFFNSLNEEQLSELEKREEKFAKEFLAAGYPSGFEDTIRETAFVSALMDMFVDSDLLEFEEEAISEIERRPLSEEERRKLEEEWKMQEALRMLEEAARE